MEATRPHPVPLLQHTPGAPCTGQRPQHGWRRQRLRQQGGPAGTRAAGPPRACGHGPGQGCHNTAGRGHSGLAAAPSVHGGQPTIGPQASQWVTPGLGCAGPWRGRA